MFQYTAEINKKNIVIEKNKDKTVFQWALTLNNSPNLSIVFIAKV